jgi:amidase
VWLKPTLGLISRSGIVPISAAQDTAGPMTSCVADAAALLGALAGADPADPATADAAGRPADYTAFLDPGALAGARLGIWRDGSKTARPPTAAVLDAAVERMRAAGAEVIDPVTLPGVDEVWDLELPALLHEFKHDLNAYLAALPGEHPATLAELIDFNAAMSDRVLAIFGQDLLERAEETSGDLTEPTYASLRGTVDRLAHAALDGALKSHRLDAVVSLTGGPARLTDHLLGDFWDFATAGPAAVCGYPSLSVMADYVGGLPVGLLFAGPRWSEPRLLALGYAFEQTGRA